MAVVICPHVEKKCKLNRCPHAMPHNTLVGCSHERFTCGYGVVTKKKVRCVKWAFEPERIKTIKCRKTFIVIGRPKHETLASMLDGLGTPAGKDRTSLPLQYYAAWQAVNDRQIGGSHE